MIFTPKGFLAISFGGFFKSANVAFLKELTPRKPPQMNPVKQTILHDPAGGQHGNCLSAVLASLLHVDIETVPVFCTPETWVKDLNAWLRPFGLAYCMVEDFDCEIEAYGIQGLWHEISGSTSRSKDVTHACVANDGELVFDPHPDNTGLTKITCHGFFIALRPWELVK